MPIERDKCVIDVIVFCKRCFCCFPVNFVDVPCVWLKFAHLSKHIIIVVFCCLPELEFINDDDVQNSQHEHCFEC